MKLGGSAGGLTLLALLAGCAADSQPAVLPPLPTSAVRSMASPSPLASPLSPRPSDAEAAAPVGAEAFALYYFELLNEGFDNGEAGSVRKASNAGCGGCNTLIAAISRDVGGKRVTGGQYVDLKVVSLSGVTTDVIVEVRYGLARSEMHDSAGQVIQVGEARRALRADLRLVQQMGRWTVHGFRKSL